MISDGILRSMLRREAELRLAPETQAAYHEAEARGDDNYSWMEVTTTLQQRVVKEFGFGTGPGADGAGASTEVSAEAALGELRAAAPRHQDVAFWQKLVQAKAKRGQLRAGDTIPAVELRTFEVDGEDVRILELVPSDGRPLAVVALSYS